MISPTLLQPPAHLSPSACIQISQQAPAFLQSHTRTVLPYPLSVFSSGETQEIWQAYETLLLACLRTGDDKSASQCLERLVERFGEKNERVQALRGLYDEATAQDEAALQKVLEGYEETLKEQPTNMPIRKRRIALLQSMERPTDAMTALVGLLDTSPTDAEAWSELADLYLAQGSYSQAIYCLEEVLLVTPNAWNVHARLAEVLYLSSTASDSPGNALKGLSESMRRFCRSIELCNDYLRGYYGLKLTTTHLLDTLSKVPSKPATATSDPVFGELAPPSLASIQRLNELATAKLAEIVRRNTAGEKGWDGYEMAEVIAARELLDRDTLSIQR
ncbi:Inositol phosphatase SIW14 [Elasticomyces elasticus]|nr:hypothetical protein LTR28_011563 [Elasticomyces elasticus]KAK4995725.1 Inositol phosphatase SIW14 [Elasticomyces elasticus]